MRIRFGSIGFRSSTPPCGRLRSDRYRDDRTYREVKGGAKRRRESETARPTGPGLGHTFNEAIVYEPRSLAIR